MRDCRINCECSLSQDGGPGDVDALHREQKHYPAGPGLPNPPVGLVRLRLPAMVSTHTCALTQPRRAANPSIEVTVTHSQVIGCVNENTNETCYANVVKGALHCKGVSVV